MLGNGLGELSYFKSLPAGTGTDQVRLADLNGNGWLDIVAQHNGAAPELLVFMALGYGHFTDSFTFLDDKVAVLMVVVDVVLEEDGPHTGKVGVDLRRGEDGRGQWQ